MAGERIRKPWVVPWTTSGEPAPLALQRTVESALRAEVAPNPGGARASGQWVRRALPLTLSGQGVVADDRAARGRDRHDRRARAAARRARSRARGWASFGRGLLRAVTAIDEAGPTDPERAARSPAFSAGPEGIVTMRNVLPDWAVRMLVGTLLLPALLAALDGLFRARRRHLRRRPLGRLDRRRAPPRRCSAWLWLRAARADRRADGPGDAGGPGPLPARDRRDRRARLDRGRRRRRLVRRAPAARRAARAGRERRRRGGLAAATGLVVNVLAAVVWLFNPYAAALLLPAAHLWLLAAAPGSRLRGPWAALPVALGVALPLLARVALRRRRSTSIRCRSRGWSRSRPPTGTSRSPRRWSSRCGSPAWPGCWSCCACGTRPRHRVFFVRLVVAAADQVARTRWT